VLAPWIPGIDRQVQVLELGADPAGCSVRLRPRRSQAQSLEALKFRVLASQEAFFGGFEHEGRLQEAALRHWLAGGAARHLALSATPSLPWCWSGPVASTARRRAMVQGPMASKAGNNGRLLWVELESLLPKAMPYEPGSPQCRVLIDCKGQIESMLLSLSRIDQTEAIRAQLMEVHRQLESLHGQYRRAAAGS
jgi:hypothetical protein